MNQIIHVNDQMQIGYHYELTVPEGQGFASQFTPHLSPHQMLALGVFEGKYINDCQAKFPALWFANARLSDTPDPNMNCFGVKSRQSLADWRANGWIVGPASAKRSCNGPMIHSSEQKIARGSAAT